MASKPIRWGPSSFIPELVSNKRRAQVILTGIFPTNCMQLNPTKIQIKRIGNVFIVLPILDYEYNIDCRSVNLPLQAVVDLGKIKEAGSYLVHIRSLSGMAVNKVFYVQDKNASPNSER